MGLSGLQWSWAGKHKDAVRNKVRIANNCIGAIRVRIGIFKTIR